MQRETHVPWDVLKLADHLVTAHAACVDFQQIHSGSVDAREQPWSSLRVELTAITHLLQARAWLPELATVEPSLARHAAVFLDATAALEQTTGADIVTPSGSKNLLLGGRIPVDAVAKLATLMLEAFQTVYPPPPAPAPVPVPMEEEGPWSEPLAA